MSRPIIYDLTELFTGSSGKCSHYGIARVVGEIAARLAELDRGVRFTVFSSGHSKFFEVFPQLDEGQRPRVWFDIPSSLRPIRFRYIHPQPTPWHRLSCSTVGELVRLGNRIRWRRAGIRLPEISLDGTEFFSAARPKLMLDMLAKIHGESWDTGVTALLHDVFSFHKSVPDRLSRFDVGFIHDTRFVISHASRLIANSEATRRDLEYFAKQNRLPPLPRLTTVPLAHECDEGSERPEIELPDEPYLLSVGSLIGRKNLECAFDAMLTLHERGRPLPLFVVAGVKREQVVRYLTQPRYDAIRDRVTFCWNPHQRDLSRLYRSAIALVIPSRLEGWGLPAGEAIWNGTPVLSSTADALREVCGDLAYYFNPDCPAELADQIDRLASDSAFRNATQRRLKLARPALRTWNDAARDLLDTLRDPGKKHQAPFARNSPSGCLARNEPDTYLSARSLESM